MKTKSCITELTKYSDKVSNEIAALYLMKIRRDNTQTQYWYLHSKLERRWRDMELYNDVVTFDGELPVWESGMDCDMVKYGHASIIDTKTYWDYEAYVTSVYENAEGPVGVLIIPTWAEYEEAKGNSYSRDLIAEATEDGHPWVVYT